MRLRTGARLAIIAAIAMSVGCGALLGLDEVTYSAADGGASLEATTDAVPDGADASVVACDANAATDPENCGRCGHSCLGGACVAGECQTFVLASADEPRGLAFVGKQVFFSETNGSGSLRTCVLGETCDGGRGDPVLPGHAGPLATDGTTLYRMNETDDQVWSCPVVGCATNAAAMAACAGGPTDADPDALLLFDGSLVWRVPASSGPTQLWACALSGGGPTRLAQTASIVGFSATFTGAARRVVAFANRDGVNGCDLSACDPLDRRRRRRSRAHSGNAHQSGRSAATARRRRARRPRLLGHLAPDERRFDHRALRSHGRCCCDVSGRRARRAHLLGCRFDGQFAPEFLGRERSRDVLVHVPSGLRAARSGMVTGTFSGSRSHPRG